jgi:cysteine desulfurase / selenocysteine lyase
MTLSEDRCYRERFVGLDVEVPLLDGSKRTYVNLDNAASTPALRAVEKAVNDFLQYYSSVHRGTGFKSQVSTHAYEAARLRVMKFLGADAAEHVCIFGKNTTEMVNHLARRFPFDGRRNIVVVSTMEHHSNDLPWRGVRPGNVLHVGVTAEGRLDMADFERILRDYAGRVALVAVTGASNVTGYINPVHQMAEMAHAAGAQIAVDCAQLAPHRKVRMGRLGEADALDYVVISGHKLYAPFGTGALVGRRDTFERGEPDHRGGGQVEFVSLEEVEWSGAPDRDEAGSPNTIGAVALAAALRELDVVGMEAVAAHEADLTQYAIPRLLKIPGLRLYGDHDAGRANERLGVLPVELEDQPHFLVSAILGHEYGIGVRGGCFCAHPYLMKLLHYNEEAAQQVRADILSNDRRKMPGLVRASFGLYNSQDEVDWLVEALERIQRKEYKGVYRQDKRSGEFHPDGWEVPFERYFEL